MLNSTLILLLLIFQYIIIASLYWFDQLNPTGSRLCLDQESTHTDTTAAATAAAAATTYAASAAAAATAAATAATTVTAANTAAAAAAAATAANDKAALDTANAAAASAPKVSYISTNFYTIYVSTTVLSSICAVLLLFANYFTSILLFIISLVFTLNIVIIMMNFAVIFPDYGQQSPLTQCWAAYTVPILVFTFLNCFVVFLFYKIKKSEMSVTWY